VSDPTGGSIQRLTETLAPLPAAVVPIIRIGKVTAVNTGPPLTVVIDGRDIRCLQSYTSPAVNDVVVWLNDSSLAVVLGRRQ
jgi:hypothetical protein